MIKTAAQFMMMRSVLAIGAMLMVGVADAVTINIVPSQTYFRDTGGTGTLTVDFRLAGGATGADSVLRSFDLMVAYNPQVLTYSSISFSSAAFGGSFTNLTTTDPTQISPANYLDGNPWGNPTTNYPVLTSALGDHMGTPFQTPSNGYFEGSIEIAMTALAGISTATLVAAQATPQTLFSITFNVALDQIAWSSIVVLDDTSFTNGTGLGLDAKHGDGTAFYLDKPAPSANDIEIPIPGTLALIGIGLLGASLRRIC